MSLGLVSPILNRGVRSRWVSTLPASSKMLTIDAAGDVSYTDIPTAAWGSITGTLSSQTDLQNALNAKLSLTGGTVTGQLTNALGTITASTPLTLTQTWNNAAVTFTGALVNVTDTASNGSSLLMDLQVGGSSKFKVQKGGNAFFSIGSMTYWNSLDNSYTIAQAASNGGLGVGGTDVVVIRDAAQTLAQRNGTNAQVFRVYNTFTDASNYERAKIAWESNVLRIGTEKAGTGSARAVEIQTDGTTRLTVASNGPVTIASSLTLGDISGSFIGWSGGSRIYCGNNGRIAFYQGDLSGFDRLQLGGTTSSFPAIKRNGTAINFRLADDSADCDITAAQISGVGGTLATGLYTSGRLTFAGTHAQLVSGGSALQFALSTGSGIVFAESSLYPVASFGGSFADNAIDIGLRPAIAGGSRFRDAYFAGTVNASKLYAYNTYTDASNYERGKIEWSSNVLRIGTEKAGTGSARALELQTDGTTRLTVASGGGVTMTGADSFQRIVTIQNTAQSNSYIRFTNTGGSVSVGTEDAIFKIYRDTATAGYLASFDVTQSVINSTYLDFGTSGAVRLVSDATDSFAVYAASAYRFRINRSTGVATFSGDVTVSAVNIVTDTTTGTKIGTATTQKIGFYNKTPVVQPAAVADATDAASVITQLNLLLSRMRDLGLIAT